MSKKLDLYKQCDENIPRICPEDQSVDPEIINRIAGDFRVLPSFEKTYYEHQFMKTYSLQTNELLRCRWQKYKDNVEHKKSYSTFHFPGVEDLHFYNGAIRFLPAFTISRIPDVRKKTKAGPSIDRFGEVPIPNESFMKRGVAHKEETISNKKIEKRSEKQGHDEMVKKSVKIDSKKKDEKEHKNMFKKVGKV